MTRPAHRSRRRRVSRPLAVLVALALCGAAALGLAARADEPTDADRDARLVLHKKEGLERLPGFGSSLDALVGGTVARTADGCWVLETATGPVIVWPAGTHADGDGVRLPGGEIVRVGDRIRGGGGIVDPGGHAFTGYDPTGCLTDGQARSAAAFSGVHLA